MEDDLQSAWDKLEKAGLDGMDRCYKIGLRAGIMIGIIGTLIVELAIHIIIFMVK